jgi:hypothetical protein
MKVTAMMQPVIKQQVRSREKTRVLVQVGHEASQSGQVIGLMLMKITDQRTATRTVLYWKRTGSLVSKITLQPSKLTWQVATRVQRGAERVRSYRRRPWPSFGSIF